MRINKSAFITLITVVLLFVLVSQVAPPPVKTSAACAQSFQPLTYSSYLGYTKQNGVPTSIVPLGIAPSLASVTVCQTSGIVILGALQPEAFMADQRYITVYASPNNQEYYMHVEWRIGILTPAQWAIMKKLGSTAIIR